MRRKRLALDEMNALESMEIRTSEDENLNHIRIVVSGHLKSK